MDLKQELNRARTETDSLFAAIDPSAIYERPISERHRMVFYLGHLEAFDWNQMTQSGVSLASHNATFDKLFEFGIDPEPGQLPADVPGDWPGIPEIERYRLQVRESVDLHLGENSFCQNRGNEEDCSRVLCRNDRTHFPRIRPGKPTHC